MIVKESCRYVRSYSELEGLQRAHTLCYSARRTETGIVLELALEEGGVRSAHRALCPSENFPRAMRLMKYLYENGVGAEQVVVPAAAFPDQRVQRCLLYTSPSPRDCS